jgi:hypothetical protein
MSILPEQMFFTVSYGGVTHMLMPMIPENQWLGNVIKNSSVPHMQHPHHLRVPPSSFKGLGYAGRVKVIYVFGNPINSVLLNFQRRSANNKNWCKSHCMNIQGDYEKFSSDWDLNDFLNQSEDLFRMEEHFNNWTSLKPESIDYEYLILKYETAAKHEAEIQAFLETNVPMSFKRRSSNWLTLPDEAKAKLLAMYGTLVEKCERFDEIRRILCFTSQNLLLGEVISWAGYVAEKSLNPCKCRDIPLKTRSAFQQLGLWLSSESSPPCRGRFFRVNHGLFFDNVLGVSAGPVPWE